VYIFIYITTVDYFSRKKTKANHHPVFVMVDKAMYTNNSNYLIILH